MRRFSKGQHAAARWLVEQDDCSFSEKRLEELLDWLTSSRDNCRDYVRIVRAWRRTLVLSPRTKQIEYPATGRPTPGRRQRGPTHH
jgi:ferric-dicitrate binding protein FerR (iron transport regulator)